MRMDLRVQLLILETAEIITPGEATAVVRERGDRSLTLCAESRTGGELGHIYDFDSKLLPRLPVDASSHHAERTPLKHRENKCKHLALSQLNLMMS